MTPTEKNNLRIVEQLYGAFSAGDMEAVRRYLDPDVELHEALSLPFGGSYFGYAEVLRGIDRVLQTWEKATSTVRHTTVGGEWVVAYVEMDVIVKKTGKPLRFEISEMWRLRDGRVVEIRPLYSDTHMIWTSFN